MPKPPATTAGYRKLIADIRKEMERGLKKVEELLERQKVLSYWAIGRRINVYLNTHEMPPGAVGTFYDDLSRELEIHDRTLPQCEQFFRYFPKFKPDKDLKWTHYRYLLNIPDVARRQAWIARIKKEGINTTQLRLMLIPAGAADDLPWFNYFLGTVLARIKNSRSAREPSSLPAGQRPGLWKPPSKSKGANSAYPRSRGHVRTSAGS